MRRNDVIHGKEIQEDSERDAQIAIECFEQLLELFDKNEK